MKIYLTIPDNSYFNVAAWAVRQMIEDGHPRDCVYTSTKANGWDPKGEQVSVFVRKVKSGYSARVLDNQDTHE